MAKERKDIAEMIDQYLSGKNVSSVDDELVPEAYERFLEKASLARKCPAAVICFTGPWRSRRVPF